MAAGSAAVGRAEDQTGETCDESSLTSIEQPESTPAGLPEDTEFFGQYAVGVTCPSLDAMYAVNVLRIRIRSRRSEYFSYRALVL